MNYVINQIKIVDFCKEKKIQLYAFKELKKTQNIHRYRGLMELV